MSDAAVFLIVRSPDGLVLNAAVGAPVPADGEEIVAREGAAADAWIGWYRQSDGSFSPPDVTSESDPEA